MIPQWHNDCLGASSTVGACRTVFFILGCQKSGTTWLQKLCNAHPQVACRGAGHYGDLLAPLVKQAMEVYNQQEKATLSFENKHLMSAVRLLIDQRLAESVTTADEPGRIRAVGDKTPEHAMTIPTLNGLYPGAKFVHVIRDGRDACVSGWAHLAREGDQDKFAAFAEYASYFAGSHWTPYIRNAQAAKAALPDCVIELRYEQLLDNPTGEAGRLFEFLGVDTHEQTLEGAVSAASFRKLSGGRSAGQESESSFFRKGVAGDWVNHFDEAATEAFEQAAGPLLDELGYARAQAAA